MSDAPIRVEPVCPVCGGTGKLEAGEFSLDPEHGVVADGTGIEWRASGEAIQYRYGAAMFPATGRHGPWVTVEHPERIVHPARVAAIAAVRERAG